MADVFISYHKNSALPLTVKVCDALEAAGISCWYAPRNEKVGVPYMRSIMRAIGKCKVFLLILNEGANKSRAVLREVHAAYKREEDGLIILPFRAESCELCEELSFILDPLQWAESHYPPNAEDIRELVAQISDILGKDPPQPPKNPPPQPLSPLVRIIIDGKCGDNITYTLDANGVLTISGAGPIQNFAWDSKNERYNTPWWEEREMISRARILKGVTSIGAYAFYGCASLASVDLPDSVTKIGEGAFEGCESLASVDLPDSVTFIEDSAFYRCVSLASVDIPDSVTSIKNDAFRSCKNLASIDIPDSVTEIGWGAFWNCENLKSVSVPAEADIGDAFDDTTEVIRKPHKKAFPRP